MIISKEDILKNVEKVLGGINKEDAAEFKRELGEYDFKPQPHYQGEHLIIIKDQDYQDCVMGVYLTEFTNEDIIYMYEALKYNNTNVADYLTFDNVIDVMKNIGIIKDTGREFDEVFL